MTTGEAIKLLEEHGFTLLHQTGSHMKYGRTNSDGNKDRVCVVNHGTKKYHVHWKEEKQIKKLIEKYKNLPNDRPRVN